MADKVECYKIPKCFFLAFSGNYIRINGTSTNKKQFILKDVLMITKYIPILMTSVVLSC